MSVRGLRGARQQPSEQEPGTSRTFLRDLRLSFASGYYTMVQALGLKRLNALIQVGKCTSTVMMISLGTSPCCWRRAKSVATDHCCMH